MVFHAAPNPNIRPWHYYHHSPDEEYYGDFGCPGCGGRMAHSAYICFVLVRCFRCNRLVEVHRPRPSRHISLDHMDTQYVLAEAAAGRDYRDGLE